MIIKRDGKYFREKTVEEEIPATEALEERIAELEKEVKDLKYLPTLPMGPYTWPTVDPVPYYPIYPNVPTNGPIWIIDMSPNTATDYTYTNLDFYLRAV